MTLITQKWQTLYSPVGTDPAISEEAQHLKTVSNCAVDFTNSASIGLPRVQLQAALEQAYVKASEDDWDGYGAVAADPDAIRHAFGWLLQLPTSTPMPSVSIDVDGHVAIEWDNGPRQIISIRLAGDGTIYYGGLLGYSTFYGAEVPADVIPEPVARAIDRILNSRPRATVR